MTWTVDCQCGTQIISGWMFIAGGRPMCSRCFEMAKLMKTPPFLADPDPEIARLTTENAALRARVETLVTVLREVLFTTRDQENAPGWLDARARGVAASRGQPIPPQTVPLAETMKGCLEGYMFGALPPAETPAAPREKCVECGGSGLMLVTSCPDGFPGCTREHAIPCPACKAGGGA